MEIIMVTTSWVCANIKWIKAYLEQGLPHGQCYGKLCYFDHSVSQFVVSKGRSQKRAEIGQVTQQRKHGSPSESRNPEPPSSMGTWWGPGHPPLIPGVLTEPTEKSSGTDAHIYGSPVYSKGASAMPGGKIIYVLVYCRPKLDVPHEEANGDPNLTP